MKFFHTFESFKEELQILKEALKIPNRDAQGHKKPMRVILQEVIEVLNEKGIEITNEPDAGDYKNELRYVLTVAGAEGSIYLEVHNRQQIEFQLRVQGAKSYSKFLDGLPVTQDLNTVVQTIKELQRLNEAYDPKSSLRKDLQTVLDWCKANDVHVVRQNLNDHNFTVFFDHDLTITVTDISHGKIMLNSMPFYFNSIEEGLNMLHQLVPSIQLRQIEELANEMGLEMTSYNIATVHRWFYFANGSALNLALKISHGLHWQISAWIRPRPNASNINAGIQTDLRSAFKLLAKSNNIKESIDANYERRMAYIHELESEINALGLEIKSVVHEGGELYTVYLPHGFKIDVIAYNIGEDKASFRLSDQHKSVWHHWTPKLANVVKAYKKLEFLS